MHSSLLLVIESDTFSECNLEKCVFTHYSRLPSQLQIEIPSDTGLGQK